MANYTARRLQTCEAWQYDPDQPIPVWVFKHCHLLDGQGFVANTLMGQMPVNVGEYIVKMEGDGGVLIGVTVCDKDSFEKEYEPTPQARARQT